MGGRGVEDLVGEDFKIRFDVIVLYSLYSI